MNDLVTRDHLQNKIPISVENGIGVVLYGKESSDEHHDQTITILKGYFNKIDVIRVSLEPIGDPVFNTLTIQDPGGIDDGSPGGFNFNRILSQVQQGTQNVSGRYLLIMRADLALTSGRFVTAQRRALGTEASFKERVVTTSIYFKTRHFNKGFRKWIPATMHPSDWIWFGLREDVERLFKGLEPLPEESAISNSCPNHDFNPYRGIYNFRFPSEMLFGMNLIGADRKHCFLDYDRTDRKTWLNFCRDNFVILPAKQFSFKKTTVGHQKAISKPLIEPTMLFATTNSRRLELLRILNKIIRS